MKPIIRKTYRCSQTYASMTLFIIFPTNDQMSEEWHTTDPTLRLYSESIFAVLNTLSMPSLSYIVI